MTVDRSSWNVVALADEWTYVSGGVYLRAVTPEITGKGLGHLVDMLGREVDGTPTLILAGSVPEAYDLPARVDLPDDREERPTNHPALESIRAHGWDVDRLAPWMRCSRGGRSVYVLVLDWDDDGENPLVHPHDVIGTVNALWAWQVNTGSVWWGNGQISGNELMWSMQLTAQAAARRNGKRAPKLDFKAARPAGVDCTENPYVIAKWSAPGHEGRKADPSWVGFDAKKAYLSALIGGTYAREALKPGPRTFDSTLAGYWLVELSPWHNELFPDPAGYSNDSGARWLTTPTLEFLAELAARDEADPLWYGGFKVVRSMVNHGTQCLRPWATKLRDTMGESPEMMAAVQAAYQRSIGSWASDTAGGIDRPDWQRTTVAKTRANIYRKIVKVWDEIGIPPKGIQTDCIYYDGERADEIRAAFSNGKPVFPIGHGLGEFQMIEGK